MIAVKFCAAQDIALNFGNQPWGRRRRFEIDFGRRRDPHDPGSTGDDIPGRCRLIVGDVPVAAGLPCRQMHRRAGNVVHMDTVGMTVMARPPNWTLVC